MSLQGVLSDFGVAEIFQLIGQQRKTGVLEVEGGERTLEVHFQEGLVLRAKPAESGPDATLADFLIRTGLVSLPSLEETRRTQEETMDPLPDILLQSGTLREDDLERVYRLITHETIFELFLWDDGHFRFRPDDVESLESDQPIGAEQVLLDALRMKDEWSQVQIELPDLSVALAPTNDIEEFRLQRETISADSGLGVDDLERLFRLADGRLAARRMIDLARTGTFAGCKGLIALRRAGLLRIAARARSAQAPPDAIAGPRPRLGLGVVALTLAAALAALLWSLDPPVGTDHPIPVDTLREARERVTADRLRYELEARRWADGRYPEALAPPAGPLDSFLAPITPDRYIYARLDAGYRLERVLP